METEDSAPSDLSELFEDDVWGTATSLDSLRHHQDYKKWMRQKHLTEKDLHVVEARLKVYQVRHSASSACLKHLL